MAIVKLVRAAVVRIFDRGDTTTILGSDGVARQLSADSAALARAVLEFVITPRTRAELLAHLAVLTGAPIEPTTVVDELLALLRAAGVVRDIAPTTAAAVSAAKTPARRTRMVLGLTGAIASMFAPTLVSLLLRRGFELRIATTRKAVRFVAPAALESLVHSTVYTSLWQRDATHPVPHINLAEWAEIVLICPASATTLSRIARGDCQDLVSAIAIATRAPVVLVPSMNTAMYTAPSVQRNLEWLREDGFNVVHPSLGHELAHRPEDRVPIFGTMPPIEDVIEIVTSIARAHTAQSHPSHSPASHSHPASASSAVNLPTAPDGSFAPESWQLMYATTRAANLPWFTDVPDPDVAAAIEQFASPRKGRFLDLGTGTGTVAIAAAALGFDVVATDIAPAALEQARARAGELAIEFKRDDILATTLPGTFEIVHDRGCLHALPHARHGEYARSVGRLTTEGSVFVVKAHGVGATEMRGTHRFTSADLAQLMRADFDLVHSAESSFPGPNGLRPHAVLCVFRRR